MAVAGLAAEHHGVVDLIDLRSAGVSRDGVRRRLESGRLHRLHRGVYAVGHPTVTPNGRRFAAVRAYGREAVASHFTAAALWGLRRSARLEVTLPTARAARDGIVPHRSRVLGPLHVDVIDRIPVTSLARTIADMAEALDGHRLERLFDHAGRHEAFDRTVLEQVLTDLNGRRDAARVWALLGGAPSPGMTRSEIEERFLALCRDHGLPTPRLNVHLHLPGYDRLVEVDAFFEGQGLIVELDGRATHDTTAAFEEDRRRDAAATAAGLRTLRYTWARVTREARQVAAELSATLAH